MYKRISYILLLIIILCLSAKAQTPLMDSLREELSGMDENERLSFLKEQIDNSPPSRYEEKLLLIKEFRRIAEESRDSILIADAQNLLSITYFQAGLYEDAIQILQKALEIYTRRNDLFGIYKINHNLGYVHQLTEDYAEAVNYYRKALAIASEMKNEYRLADEYFRIGEYSRRLENNDTASKYLQLAIGKYEQLHLTDSLAKCLTSMVELSFHKPEISGGQYYQQLLHLPLPENASLNNLITLTSIRYQFREGNVEQGRRLLDRFLDKHPELGQWKKREIETIYWYRDHYTQHNNYAAALKYQKEVHRKERLFFEFTRKQRIEALKIKLGYDQKELMLQAQKEETRYLADRLDVVKKNQNYLYMAIGLLTLIIAVSIFYYCNNRYINAKLLEQQEDLKQINAAMKRSNEDYANTQLKKSKFIQVASEKLMQPFRYLVWESKKLVNVQYEQHEETRKLAKQLHTSSEEVFIQLKKLLTWSRIERDRIKIIPDHLSVYDILSLVIIDLTREKMHKQLHINTIGDTYTKVLFDNYCLKNIVKTLLENAIKYSYENSEITIEISDQDNETALHFIDQGIGMDREITSKLFSPSQMKTRPGTKSETGIGLGLIIAQQLATLNKSTITVSSTAKKGSIFTLHIPKDREYE